MITPLFGIVHFKTNYNYRLSNHCFINELILVTYALISNAVENNYLCYTGGAGNFGDVISTDSFGTGDEINGVKVRWSNNASNSYRLGYQGKVDIVCVEETPGMDYYRDHLFVLSKENEFI